MTESTYLDEATRKDMLQRLKRIEGQSRGIQHMIEEGRDCQDILNQIAAMRAATHSLGIYLLEEFAQLCLHTSVQSDTAETEKKVAQMVSMISKLTR